MCLLLEEIVVGKIIWVESSCGGAGSKRNACQPFLVDQHLPMPLPLPLAPPPLCHRHHLRRLRHRRSEPRHPVSLAVAAEDESGSATRSPLNIPMAKAVGLADGSGRKLNSVELGRMGLMGPRQMMVTRRKFHVHPHPLWRGGNHPRPRRILGNYFAATTETYRQQNCSSS